MAETIALYCGTSVRSVQNHIKQLLEDGYITRRRRFMDSSVYRIDLAKLHADAEKFDALMRARKEARATKKLGFDATDDVAAAKAEVAALPENPASLPEDTAPVPENFAVYDMQNLQTEPVAEPVDKPIIRTSPAPAPCPTPPAAAPAAATPTAQPVVVVANEIPENLLADWILVRESKGRKVLTATELDTIRSEAAQAGISLADAVRECVNSGWVRFKAAWLPENPMATVPSATPVDAAILEKMAAQQAAPVQDVPQLSAQERAAFNAAAERIKSTVIAKPKLAWAEEAIALRRSGVQISHIRLKNAMSVLGLSDWKEVSCAA